MTKQPVITWIISTYAGYPVCMADSSKSIGPTGDRVRENLVRLRGEMGHSELSRRLAAAGRPIAPLGLRRLEAGERRVDVDDLMALAVVLDVSPLALLLPPDASPDTDSVMTGVNDRNVAHEVQWKYGLGQRPILEGPPFDESFEAIDRFRKASVPTIANGKGPGDLLGDPPEGVDPVEHGRAAFEYAISHGWDWVAEAIRASVAMKYGTVLN